jgi:hypothetical protein
VIINTKKAVMQTSEVEEKLYLVPAKMIGSQNKFSSPPTPFETRGRNVTVCPANICCYHSNIFPVTEMLSAYCTLQIYRLLFSTLTNKLLIIVT